MTIGRFTPLPLVWRRLTVLRTSNPTPRMRRVTLGGPEVRAFTRDGLDLPAFTSLAFDDHVKIVLAPGGDLAEALPVQRENGIEWPESAIRVTRDYTPVHVDAEAGELSLDFVVHSPEGAAGAGPAEAWAAAAEPGDELVIVGPKSSTIVPDDARWAFLIGDETGLPAIERFLSERPVTGPVTVVVQVTAHEALPELPLRQQDSLIVVVSEAGAPKALVNALHETSRPDGPGYVWAGAESRSLLAVRRLVTRDWGVPKDRQNITGYWHRVDVRRAEPAPGTAASPLAGQVLPVLPQVVHSPVSWFAVRIALRSGLLGRCETGPAALDQLAADLDIPITRLDPLVRLLTAAEVLVANDDGTVAVGPGGELILGDEHVAELFDGWWADQVMTLTDLDERLGDDQPNWRQRCGDSYFEHMTADAERYGELMETAERLTFLLPAIRSVPALAGDRAFVAAGPGAAIVAGALAADGRAVRIVEGAAGARDALAAAVGDAPVEVSGAFGEDSPVIAALALDARDDAEAAEYLAGLASTSSSLVLIEATGTDGLGPLAGEQAVVRVGVNGARPRTRDDLEKLAKRSGWRIGEATPLGWGVEALTLEAAPAR